MIKPKISVGDEERAFIFSERKRTSFSAEYVSEKIGRSKSWLAQIENGRTKTINRIDFINLISFLRQDDDLLKIEAFIQASMIAASRNLPMPTSPDDDRITFFIDNSDYSPQGLDDSFKEWLSFINTFFKTLYEQYPEKKEFIDILSNMQYNLMVNPSLVISILGFPLNRLKNASKDNLKNFYDEFGSLIDKYGSDDDFDLFMIDKLKNN